MNISVMVSYLVGMLVLYLGARLLLVPLRVVTKLLVNGIVGGILLALFNLGGSYWGLYLAINPLTAMIAGLLGIPGVFLLVALRYVLT